MKKWTEILSVLICAAILSLGGCGDRKGSKEFTVAAIVPKTGPIGYLGEQELAGLELAAEDINSKGGISGRMVRIKWEDTGGDVAKAVTAANKLLLNENVDMLFVTTTGAVKAIAPIAEAKGIPLIAMAADTGITNLNKYLFRMYMNFDDEQNTLASYIGERGLKRVVLIRPEDEAFKNSQLSLQKYLQPRGISIAGAETFTRQTKDYRVQIEKLLRVAPDSIVVLGYGPDFPTIVEQIKQNPLSKNVAILGGYALISKAAQQNGTDVFKEIPFVSFAAISSPTLQKFSSRVTARLGRPAGQFLDYLYAYDSLMFIGSLGTAAADSGKLLAAIEQSKGYEGIGGAYKFNNARDASVPLAVAQFFESEAKIVWAPPK
jgi:ABC-type branched-subunit amino acid transport system substrate-binding protein